MEHKVTIFTKTIMVVEKLSDERAYQILDENNTLHFVIYTTYTHTHIHYIYECTNKMITS